MERMKQDIKYVSIGMYKQLEEENKKLKEERDLYKARNEELNENCFGLAKENENLKSDLGQFSEAYKRYRDYEKEELAESCYDLEKENKELKKELELVRKNTRANVETLDNMYGELVDLKKENKELQKDLDHRDSFFSIMRDVLANETITNNEIAMITYCVVHEECGDYDLSKKELKIAKEFWGRKYV